MIILINLSLPFNSICIITHYNEWYPAYRLISNHSMTEILTHSISNLPSNRISINFHYYSISLFRRYFIFCFIFLPTYIDNTRSNKVKYAFPPLLSDWVLIINVFFVYNAQSNITPLRSFNRKVIFISLWNVLWAQNLVVISIINILSLYLWSWYLIMIQVWRLQINNAKLFRHLNVYLIFLHILGSFDSYLMLFMEINHLLMIIG